MTPTRISLVMLLAVAALEMGRAQTQPTPLAPLRFPQAPAVSPLGARNDLPNPYQPGVSWGQLPSGRKWGSTAGIWIAPDGHIWALDRCGASGAGGATCFGSPLDPILEFDQSGKLLKSFGAGLLVSPHKITVDRDGNVWVADNGVKEGKGQQVFKFSRDGKVLMTLGKAGVAGPASDTFDQPTEVAIAPSGDIFVADGHGRAPTANARIQIFDQDGNFIAEWKQFGRPSGIFIDKDDVLYVADSESRDGEEGYGLNAGCRRGIRIGSARDGSVKYFVPDTNPYPPTTGSTFPEGITVDTQGNMYGAEFTMDVKKFVKKP